MNLIYIISLYALLFYLIYNWDIEDVNLLKKNPTKYFNPILNILKKQKRKYKYYKFEVGIIFFEMYCHFMLILVFIDFVFLNNSFFSNNKIFNFIILYSGVIVCAIYYAVSKIAKK